MIIEGKRFTFYRKTSFGISTWTLWYEGNVVYYGSCIAEGGSMSVHKETVTQNMSGRNMAQQIESQMRSRLSKMMDKGYKSTRDEALQGATNQMGLTGPMKAQTIQKVTIKPFARAYVQRKYNGHRCAITCQEGQIIPYTIKGKPVLSIDHITNALKDVLPEGMTLDGELYMHGASLQKISSLIKRNQADSAKLCYHVYDVMAPEFFGMRFDFVRKLLQNRWPFIEVVPTFVVYELGEAFDMSKKFIEEGYEGAMIRFDIAGYEGNLKRSNQILKIKEWLDDDYLIIGATPAKNGEAIFTLQLDNGKTFDCLAPGSVPEKQAMMQNIDDYIGRRLTVKYANLTDEGVPFHGVAVQMVEEI